MPADLTQAAGGVMVLFFLALILHSLWQLGRRFPPVIDQAPSGVEGWLMAVASLAVAAGLFNLTSFGLLLNAALTDAARSGGFPAGFWTAYGLPAAVGFAGYLWAALRLITGRTSDRTCEELSRKRTTAQALRAPIARIATKSAL